MPNFMQKVSSALKKQLGGDIPPEAKVAYEEEKKKAIIKGAKVAGRREGYRRGKAMGKGGGLGRKFLKDIATGSANVLSSDPFGMDMGSFDIDKAGMINPFKKTTHSAKRQSKKQKAKRDGQTIRIVVQQPQKKKSEKPKRKKLANVFMM